jgi:hypothetical protein
MLLNLLYNVDFPACQACALQNFRKCQLAALPVQAAGKFSEGFFAVRPYCILPLPRRRKKLFNFPIDSCATV